MENKQKFKEIPARCFDPERKNPVAEPLRSLKIGEAIDFTSSKRNAIHAVASRLGIVVKTRNLGRKNKITVYRVG